MADSVPNPPATKGTNDPNTETNPDGTPKLSKRAAEKAAKKAGKVAMKAAAPPKAPRVPKPLAERPKQDNLDPHTDAMDACFTVGWLRDVYLINPTSTSVRTRFPPEPNGYLHIGHAKAIGVNFGFAKHYGGKCYLRYDDTNPVAEDEQYFASIKESVEWLGYEPAAITHSSDHFQRLYSLAETLILRDKAYVCHCSAEEIRRTKGERIDEAGNKSMVGERYACAHRDRPVQESLTEFRAMRDDKYAPQTAVLRMKQALLTSGNTNMWDLPAYRILEPSKRHHHKTGNQWAIYPTYDFTHCLCDAFEEITHSLCTVEFRTARESYDWLVDELFEDGKLPAKPQQREYSRLNVDGTVLSKRKILKLVNEGYVRDWDDPRLYTIIALRRRGIPPGAIRAFVAELGVSDALATSIQLVRLETVVRKYLEKTVPRLMVVIDPILVVIDDKADDFEEEVSMEFMPRDASFGTHTVPFTKRVYIDRSDFREEADANFFRLQPGGLVGLLNVPFPIRATTVERDADGKVTVVHATYEKPVDGSAPEKSKAFIQWVAESPKHKSPVRCEVRMFNSLFKSAKPNDAQGGFLKDINPDSETVYANAVMETGFYEIREKSPWPKDHVPNLHPGPWGTRFQGMRVAYFALDRESEGEKVILNKIVSLKEDVGKKG